MKNKFFKKTIAVLLSIAMLLPMLPVAYAAQPSDFTDFPTGWSNEAMTAAVANGLLNGRTTTTIEPQGNLTRAEMATIINRAFGAVKMADISKFNDVSADDWFYTEIAKAVNMQTFQGDATGVMRPNAPITREEVFAVVARALVLETSDFSALGSHPDGQNVSGWAKPYAAILSQKKYINGDANGNLNPHSNITREEFAQIMHNIIKTYYTTPGEFKQSGAASSLIRTSGVTLSNVTINGDLIIGDGVGAGTVVLKNVIIKGRLLARGGEGSITLTNTKVGEGVVVKDVNGIVHFNNYRAEAPFVGIREITKATFKTSSGIAIGGGSSTSKPVTYTVTINGAGYTNKTYSVNSGKNFTFPGPNGAGHDAFAGWVLSTDSANEKVYKKDDTCKINGNVTFVPVYYYNVEHYFQLEANSDAYRLDKKLEKAGYARVGETVVCDNYLDVADYDEIKYSPNKQYKTEDRQGEISQNTVKTFKLYYDFNPTYEYKIEYYISSLSNPQIFEKHDELTKIKKDFAGAQVFAGQDDKTVRGYIFKDTHADNVTEGVVTADGNFALKLYYDRCDVTIEYVLGDGKFRDGIAPVTQAKFGATITLPGVGDMENSYDLSSWYSNPSIGGANEFAPQHALVITDYDDASGEPKIRLTAVWGNTKFYKVVFFNHRYQDVETVRVPEGATVDKNVFTSLAGNLLSFAGYEENSDISLLYAQDPYVHTVNSAWYYKPDLNATPIKWERFDSNIKITGDIADADDIVKVNVKIPRITITARLVQMSNLPYSFTRAYEEQGLTIDAMGNSKKTGTRLADTIKDFLWDALYKGSNGYNTEGYKLIRQQIEKAGDKAFGKLRDKGILDDNNKILDQSFTVKFASFIDRDLNKANIRKFIIDKAKDTLENDDTLHDAIIDYFESIANSGDGQAIADLEDLIEGTVKEALSDGNADTTKLAEEMCEKLLEDPSELQTAIKEVYEIDVVVDSAALEKPAKDFIKDEVIDELYSKLLTDDDFFDDTVGSQDFDISITAASLSGKNVAACLEDIVVEKINSITTADDLAKLAGYADWNEFVEGNEDAISDAIVDQISSDDTVYHKIVEALTGNTYDASIENDPKAVFGEVVDKLVDDAINNTDEEVKAEARKQIEKLLEKPDGVQVSDTELSDIQSALATAERDDILDDYLAMAVGDDTDTVTFADYANTRELISDVINERLASCEDLTDTIELLGIDSADILDEAKVTAKSIIDDKIDENNFDGAFVKDYLSDNAGIDYDGNIDPSADAREFIVDIIKINAPTDFDDDFAKKFGYNSLDDLLKDAVLEMFGFVPDNITTKTTKQFITDIIVDMFETTDAEHIAKRDKMIHFAVVEIVEHNHIDMLDDYVDYAIEHLDSLPGEKEGTTRLDETIDEIIESKYEDTINTLVDELVDGEQLTIKPDVKFVLEAINDMIDDYSYDAIKDLIVDQGAPESLIEKVFKIYPEATLRAIYDKPYNEVVAQIDQGLIDNTNGQDARINTGMTFKVNPVKDIYVPLYDTNFSRFVDIAKSKLYYDQNEYLQELATMTSPATFFDGNEADGYRLKSYSEYYDLVLRLAIVGDDAINWYTENLTEQQLDELVLNYEDFFVEKANMLADMLEAYADTGDLPDKLDNNIVSAIEQKLTEKFGSLLDEVLEWYKTSPLNKEYGSGDYEYIRKAVNKAFNGIDITTDEAFDLLDKLCNKVSDKYDDLDDIHDKIVKIDADTYAVTIKGKTLTIKRINDNEFEATFNGKVIKVLRSFDDGYGNYCESYQINFEGNYIELRRAIEG
ncbi:MAG: S-layer homology domain-containing protein [Clostridia bacterium]|nr:S-layer homology domain-containing protein [Clostridia bacterium]